MPLKRMVMELGMGTDIRGQDYTKAATRAVHNALRQNSLVVADAFGVPREEMVVDIIIGVAEPDKVDKQAVADMLPYGRGEVRVERGGMDTPKDDGSRGTIMANAALIVYLDLPDGAGQ
ncbi:Lin0512 family protein [Pseudahrensia aquimaris]|uniref:Lin0512 family protein n=2 Tax=Pseudahrensia aquimaris TaxID=744461 RepID=A0ABW3FBT6_9HYPH